MVFSVQVGRLPVPVGGGSSVECVIDSTLANVMIKWDLVGLDESQVEISAYGSLNEEFTKTDKDGHAFNYYIAPATDPPVNHKDRVKVEVFA